MIHADTHIYMHVYRNTQNDVGVNDRKKKEM